jgi:predicted nucleic acid-binding protein
VQVNRANLKNSELASTSTMELMERALELACQYGVTAYDACYIALSDRRQVPLLTADSRLVEKMSGSPFSIMSLSQ